MTTDQKEAAVQRLAAAYAAEWPTDKPMMGNAPMLWLRKLARIAIEQAVVPASVLASRWVYDALGEEQPDDVPIPWDAVCPGEEKP